MKCLFLTNPERFAFMIMIVHLMNLMHSGIRKYVRNIELRKKKKKQCDKFNRLAERNSIKYSGNVHKLRL